MARTRRKKVVTGTSKNYFKLNRHKNLKELTKEFESFSKKVQKFDRKSNSSWNLSAKKEKKIFHLCLCQKEIFIVNFTHTKKHQARRIEKKLAFVSDEKEKKILHRKFLSEIELKQKAENFIFIVFLSWWIRRKIYWFLSSTIIWGRHWFSVFFCDKWDFFEVRRD